MKNSKRILALVLTLVLVLSTVLSLAACTKKQPKDPESAVIKQGTYRTYTTVLPSNWNELTYEDANDTQILDYLVSPFFEYDYLFDEAKGGKFKADGTINFEAIVPGGYSVKFSAATKLEDITNSVDAKWGYTADQKSAGSYAWRITLREDLKWNDGTPIKAGDFVYTMQQQLDPLFFNMRASSYYNNMRIKNARQYLYGGQLGGEMNMISENYGDDEYVALEDLTKDADGYYKHTVNGTEYYIVFDLNDGGNWDPDNGLATYYDYGYIVETEEQYKKLEAAKNPATGIIKMNEELVLALCDVIAEMQGFASAEEYAEAAGDYAYLEWEEFAYYGTTMESIPFENVGIYAEGDYALVICLDAPIEMLKEDGSLSYLAAYNFSSLPLVKKDLYESCKKAPQEGSTLWTTNYNSSLDTTASWGPYMLTQFQSGKSYTLTRNDNWYGYGLEDNKNQYNITAIECEVIDDINTQWMSFLNGSIDDIGLDVDHKDDYRNSKYTFYAPGTGTFGINIYSNLAGLKGNGRNNSILAILDFRKAISLYIDRDDYNATIYTSHRSCYGLLGPSYYYDVENGGVYRDTQTAKEALLRVYGFSKNADGKWTDGNRTYGDYQEAYDAMNGMNRTLAKQLVESAYAELTANADTYGYDATKNITIKYGASADNENSRRGYDYIVNMFNELVKDTPLEGKITLEFDASAGSGWANAFKNGSVDLAAGTGFSGGAFDPEGFLQCYVDPEAGLMYSTWWDTASEKFTYTMPAGDYPGAGQELTMSVLNWYHCLNSMAEDYYDGTNGTYTYNWGAGAIPEEARMMLLGAIEELVLNKYYTVITTSQFSATVYGAKFTNASTEYNIFMGFGGMRYMIVNYTDEEWSTYVTSQNNDLSTEYKKTN